VCVRSGGVGSQARDCPCAVEEDVDIDAGNRGVGIGGILGEPDGYHDNWVLQEPECLQHSVSHRDSLSGELDKNPGGTCMTHGGDPALHHAGTGAERGTDMATGM
jgi:hypothetical protein